jgi:hypothetical protein
MDKSKAMFAAMCLACLIGFCVVSETSYQEARIVPEIENPRLKGLLSNALISTNNKMVIVQNEY